MIRIGAFALASVAALTAGVWMGSRTPSAPRLPEIDGYVLTEPRDIPAFELLAGDGEPFRNEDFKGAWSFVYFGYTYCPDACPLTMTVFAQVKAALADMHVDVPVTFYLISVDPARDTPERMAEYVAYFDPEFRGLVGPYAQLEQLTRPAGIAYIVPDAQADENYLVDHSSSITLLDPDGRIHAIFTAPHDANILARDFVTVVDGYRR